jgi:hypothetical protein
VTSDEFDHLRQLVDVAGSPEMLVRNLGRADVNVRKWVLEVFAVDVMTTDRVTVQVARIGLRVIANRLDTMVREGLQFAPSPNVRARKTRAHSIGDDASRCLSHDRGAVGGIELTPFTTPPGFRTHVRVTPGTSVGTGVGGQPDSNALLAALTQQSKIAQQGLATCTSMVEALVRTGQTSGTVDGVSAERKMAAQQAVVDKVDVYRIKWPC